MVGRIACAFLLAGTLAAGTLGIEPLIMSQPEFERYFKADVLDTEKLAQQAGIQKQ